MKKESLIKKAFCSTMLIAAAITVKAQCPDGSTVTANNKCLFLSWNTPPSTLPTSASVMASGIVYTYQSGTGTVADPALYRNTAAGSGACNAATNFSGQLTFTPGGQTCIFVDGGQPLPLTLVDFTAKATEPGTVTLTWEISDAKDFRHFEVERNNGKNFELADVISYNAVLNRYSYTDRNLSAGDLYQYRLKMVDLDGTFSYSPVRTAFIRHSENTVTVYPNPSTGMVTISGLKTGEQVQIFDVLGRTVISKHAAAQQEHIDITDLPQGPYHVTINDGTGRVTTVRLVKAE